MNAVLKNLLAYKNLGTILFDKHFEIIEADRLARNILGAIGPRFPDGNLLNVFPEFVGNEQLICRVLEKKASEFHLKYVNRFDSQGHTLFWDLLILPDERPERGILVVEDVTEQAKALQEINQQKYELFLYRHDPGFRKKFLSESILGKSKAIQQLRDAIHKLSKVPSATVLLLGETGTGKNLAARVIHYSSMPADAPFVHLNCAALPEHLFEAELFGYEKGAFTHAAASRPGLMEESHGGTIFLDEIGELPINVQAKLLTVLETKKFRRLGSNRPIELKTRIIAATNRSLPKDVQAKKFREDLFYRLNVVSLTMPPLRALGDDILTISDHFLNVFNVEFKKRVKGFAEDARKVLRNYHWPGNVRELSNCLERAMIFIEKDWITARDLVIFNPPTDHPPSTLPNGTFHPAVSSWKKLSGNF
ncbi:MAG: sigma-54-dependent Fis family transcriptional regulator [Desulfobacterales bacterium]|nr:MAG: sigma-54-dependent Fis family transcriptional regulator [Desulfobacterales bacterium]